MATASEQLLTHLRSRTDLISNGMSSTRIRSAVAAKTLHRVHRGWYVDRAAWNTAHVEQRHLLRVHAAARTLRTTGTAMIRCSAAVLWGFPLLLQADPTWVHVAGDGLDGWTRQRGAKLARHEIRIPPEDVTRVDGIACTTFDRTVLDMMLSAPRFSAVGVVDAAMRRVAWDDRRHAYDEDRAERWRSGMWRRLDRMKGYRGIAQARWALGFGDGRADGPGESKSRVLLSDLGFAPLRLQVAIPGPEGTTYWTDFGLDSVPAWGEFDGDIKYFDPTMAKGKTPKEVLHAEKDREAWIRQTTGRPVARWGMKHLKSADALAQRLARYGIEAP